MATITIRNLDDSLKKKLRLRSAQHDRSMEEEARVILRDALQGESSGKGLGQLIQRRFAEAGGVDLELPMRKEMPRKADIGE